MKSRTSFFDKTVLKKDMTRFFPLWALYLIGGLLFMHILSGFYGSYYPNRDYSAARDLNALIGPMSLVHAGYAFLAAQLLFGDLHNTRLCYGLHSMPLRREGWYLTHAISGLLMGTVPSLVIALTLLPVLGQFWFVGFFCWSALSLHYLFFFGLSALCMMVTGNRFAASAVYGILNFLSLIVQWFAQTIYLPLLPGVRTTGNLSNLLSPVVTVIGRDDFFRMVHSDSCACYRSIYYHDGTHQYAFHGLGDDWGYLLILAGVGIALLGAGLLLYRIRHLERAGDFIAFRPMKPIFLWVYTLSVGGVLFYLAYEMANIATGFVFFVVGIFIGFFTGKMLLERTIRVFKGKSFIGLGILYAAVALSLLLTWADPIGISRRIPDSQKVESVYLYDGYLSDYQLNNTDRLEQRQGIFVVTDPEHIAEICDIHRIMLKENADTFSSDHYFTLSYQMKNGTRILRTYRIQRYGAARESLKKYLTQAEYLFGAASLEELHQKTQYLYYSEVGNVPESLWPELLKALWLDAQGGNISYASNFFTEKNVTSVELHTTAGYRTLFCAEDAPYLRQWKQQYQTAPQLLLRHDTLEKLQVGAKRINCNEYNLDLHASMCQEFLELLWQDCKAGLVSAWGKEILVLIRTDHADLEVTLSPESDSAQWLKNLSSALE